MNFRKWIFHKQQVRVNDNALADSINYVRRFFICDEIINKLQEIG